ncbi:LysR family transcriptional regulator [Variovorax sp. OV329]|uniref:LysR family transcriptional regulator n=1 Tax=Variovorax sp. OV329 TaxID=1882825 RepID=UPI0008E6A939|nr:LysR family transcriptional regulator [Variovorax sp. OV329]SFN21780.1 transcriptional regulator, LysR family [Variovorax sp. OV329]
MNWDDARIFLALCRETTLRAAARSLAVDQATVGRRLNALEAALGVTLFFRSSDGYLLTPAGESAFSAARRMEQAALDLRSKVEGHDAKLGGLVRVTSTDSIAVDFLMPALALMPQSHPGIRVDLEVSTQILSLTKRQADLAFRNVQPDAPDLIIRRVVNWPVGLFASETYLRRYGEPPVNGDFAGHQLVAYKPYLEQAQFLSMADVPARQGRIALAVNSSFLVRKAVAAGIGVGEMPLWMGEREGLVRVWPQRRRATDYQVWLVMHPDLRRTARVQAVAELLSSALKKSAKS